MNFKKLTMVSVDLLNLALDTYKSKNYELIKNGKFYCIPFYFADNSSTLSDMTNCDKSIDDCVQSHLQMVYLTLSTPSATNLHLLPEYLITSTSVPSLLSSDIKLVKLSNSPDTDNLREGLASMNVTASSWWPEN